MDPRRGRGYGHAMALLCGLLGGCHQLLDSSEARYVEEAPLGPTAGNAGTAAMAPDAATREDAASGTGGADAARSEGDQRADAGPMPECSADAECEAQAYGCEVAACDRRLGACRYEPATDCTACGPISDGLCVTGRCLEGGILYASDLEDDRLSGEWTTPLERPWTTTETDRHSGHRSAVSGRIPNQGVSTLELTLPAIPDPSKIAFWVRVSSELGDKLDFMINDVVVRTFGGQVEWQLVEEEVGARGKVTFTWRYEKDLAGHAGEDRAYIDDVVVRRRCP